MTTSIHYDAIVIGAGQAGPSLAVRLAKAGLSSAIVERGELGGTCVNNGCMPTKTLVASARVAHLVRRAADFGVRMPGPVDIDALAVRARAMKVVQDARDGLSKMIVETPNIAMHRGEARFTSPHTLRIAADDLELHAERFFLNVGARAIVPDWIAQSGVPWLTNVSILGLDVTPEHLVVLGAGYISLEYAQVYRRFGARVTVIEHGERFLPREDEDTAAAVREVLEREGIVIRTGVDARTLAPGAGGRGIALGVVARGAPAETVPGSHLLVAIGRRPNTDNLGLEAAGVACDERGYVRVDEQLRTDVPHIWALGDMNGRGAFTHTSYNDYEIVAANLFDGEQRRVSDRVPVYSLFTDPPLARIGMNKDAARKSGRRVLVGHRPMTRVSRAVERDETDGFMEALVDADSKQLLGATMFCIEGDEAIHALLDVMSAGVPYTAIARTMHIHPTVSELVPTMLQDLKPLE